MNNKVYADDLFEVDENGNNNLKDSKISELAKAVVLGKVEINIDETVTDHTDGKQYPKWIVDDFVYCLDEETFTYLPLILK